MAQMLIPKVSGDRLLLSEEDRTIVTVGSHTWYAWLADVQNKSFSFKNHMGVFTARHECQRNNWYWYAYQKQGGKIRKAYLGKPEELTIERLNTIVMALVEKSNPGVPGRYREQIVAAKLTPPAITSDLLSRPDVQQKIVQGLHKRLTLITAPAGWGKTTLLSQFYGSLDLARTPTAWLTLDASDNHPASFWSHFITTLDNVQPGIAEATLPALFDSPYCLEHALRLLLNTLSGLFRHTTVILDNYNVITSPDTHQTMATFIDMMPSHLHFILAGRSLPSLPLTRLRAQGNLAELRAADLRFSLQDIYQLAEKLTGLTPLEEDCAALEAYSEGWITALRLRLLAPYTGRAMLVATNEDSRYSMDYLIEEVLLAQTEEVQTFLWKTAVLDHFNSGLCDALCERTDSQAILEYLERESLFIVVLNDQRQWFRYHPLFANALRAYLREKHAVLVNTLYMRASEWHEKRGLLAEAVHYAWQAAAPDNLVRLIEQHALSTLLSGQVQLVKDWLDYLPEMLVRTRPALCLIHALVLLYTQRLEESEVCLHTALFHNQQETRSGQEREAQGRFAAVYAVFAFTSGDFVQSQVYAQCALDNLPETDTLLHTTASAYLLATSYLLDGDVATHTERAMKDVVTSVRAAGNIFALLRTLAGLAHIKMLQGRLREAKIVLERIQCVIRERKDIQIGETTYVFGKGEVLYEWNQLTEAEHYLRRGVDIVRSGQAFTAHEAMRGYIALAHLQQANACHNEALATMQEFEQLAYQHHIAAVQLDTIAAVKAQLKLAQGNIASAQLWAESSGLSAYDTPQFAREREYLTWVRVNIALGRSEPEGQRLHDLLDLLGRLQQDAESKHRMRSVLEILILRALALQAQNEVEMALSSLTQALALAEQDGHVRLFLDEGVPMLVLLRQLRAQQRSTAENHVDDVLAHFAK